MKLFETFREFRVFVFRYRATNENAELEENKIRVIFEWENLWKGIRVSLGMILRLFYQQRKEIIIFRGFHRFPEFREIDLAHFLQKLVMAVISILDVWQVSGNAFALLSVVQIWPFSSRLNYEK